MVLARVQPRGAQQPQWPWRARGRHRGRQRDAHVQQHELRRRCAAALARDAQAIARDHAHECGRARLAREPVVGEQVVAMRGEAPGHAGDMGGGIGQRGGRGRPVRVDVLDAERTHAPGQPQGLRVDHEVRQQRARARGAQPPQRLQRRPRRAQQLAQRGAEHARRPRRAGLGPGQQRAGGAMRHAAVRQQRDDAHVVAARAQRGDLVDHEGFVAAIGRARGDVQQPQAHASTSA
jgi:hypothetical protein